MVTRDWPARLDPEEIKATLIRLFDRAGGGPLLEPELEAAADDALGREQGLVARLALPIGQPEPFGVLVVAHAETRSRGCTNVCKGIGQAQPDAPESLLIQAITREELAAQRDQFAQEARTDALTGLPNRLAWQEILDGEAGQMGALRPSGYDLERRPRRAQGDERPFRSRGRRTPDRGPPGACSGSMLDRPIG